MPSAIPDMMKSEVIRQWLNGRLLDDIIRDNNISTGGVSGVVSTWV
ncbi:MAG: hypothetical protein M3297_12215 [Thermoproteota archaeon]|nr:hypothetical protein [Thermoproteota archaeon]